jgi:hypothetical protein
MTAYAINYDLKKPGHDYAGLYEAIKASGKWWHYLQSTWLVTTNETPTQIWERLRLHVDTNDFVLIIEVKHNVMGWLPADAWKWIDDNVGGRVVTLSGFGMPGSSY